VVVLVPLCAGLFWRYLDCKGDQAELSRRLELDRKSAADTSAQLKEALDEVTRLKEKSRILQLFGSRYWGYRSFDLRKEIGATIELGQCLDQPCYRIEVVGLNSESTPPTVELQLDGKGFTGLPNFSGKFVFRPKLSLVAGKRMLVQAQGIEFLFAIEDDRMSSLRLGIGIRDTSNTGLLIRPATDEDIK